LEFSTIGVFLVSKDCQIIKQNHNERYSHFVVRESEELSLSDAFFEQLTTSFKMQQSTPFEVYPSFNRSRDITHFVELLQLKYGAASSHRCVITKLW
jgi:hypothetical protein